ncbi:hypothetical protein AX774_g309 [Zancudomyces culisetae]|uniref:Xylanolytic transcriptional activator regulatory domain-containing protein n=1 Tax=Zancudomyces culisetae TaxID=1213189 RepID=A0A1R1PYT8_ZANCU|nr:hypothetical protein AX774_g309 [Zancudomyces culisetae]|eukprot:OMH86123.1 hypothetical protein AX774_g309 [Zancudomyces culisetae]
MHIIKFRLNEKKKVIKRSVNEVLHGKLAGIEKKVEILDKKVKKMKTASKRNLGHNAKHKTKNLMTDVCIVSVNIQSTIGRDSEDIELSRLLRDVIDELMDRFIYRYPLIANVVRIPQFIQNVKSFQVPKYVVCTLLLMGSTVLKNDKFFEAFGEEKRKRTLNYATGHMEKVLVNPDCLGIWTMMILSRYYLTLGILTQYTKYLHLATRLAISMRLHRVDDYYTGSSTNQSESLVVEKELKRRLWWCLYIHSIYVSEAISVQPPIQLKDIFANLPGTDRLWHSDTNLMLPKAKSANKGDVLLSSRGGFKLDTFASRHRVSEEGSGAVP